MMRNRSVLVIVLALWVAQAVAADGDEAGGGGAGYERAAAGVQDRLEKSLAELSDLRETIAEKKVPLSRKLNELESELVETREEFQSKSRRLDSNTLDLSNLRSEIESRNEEVNYLSNLLGEYIRNFESRLHIVETDRYRETLEAAKLAPDNSNLSKEEVYEAQIALVETSLARLEGALGGTRFEGRAVSRGGRVKPGRFVLVGPAALFRSEDGGVVGTAEERLGSAEPTVIAFKNPGDAEAAENLVRGSEAGEFPLDPTLGKAHQIETTRATFWEDIQKGGPVMVPIFALAAASLLVAVYKWIALTLTRNPSHRKITPLLNALAAGDERTIKEKARAIKGPVGDMLQVGVRHLDEPRELIEEVMYEKVLSTRVKVQRLLPFIAITAASAPLLGLLGTVTGIINTFELITAFGTGDVQTLSGGISEALVTTKYGLIVAVPSLLLHAFLSRKARRITDQMEKATIAFVNEVGRARHEHAGTAA